MVHGVRQQILLAGLVLFAAASLARGQDVERRLERLLRNPAEPERLKVDTTLSLAERATLDYGGFFSFSALNLKDENANDRRLLQYDTTLYARVSLDGAHTLFGRARFRYRDFSEGDSFDGRGDRFTKPFIDRFWYEFDLRQARAAYGGRLINGDVNVRVGRQFVDWGAGLALSENLYAARPTVSWGRVSVEGLAGVTPPDESVIDFDASRADFNSRTHRGFFGGLVRYTTRKGAEFYAYGLHMRDYNSGDTSRLDIGMPVDFDYEATYLGVGAQGSLGPKLLYLAEYVHEIGHSMSDPLRGAQTREDINAFAARGELTYVFRDPRQSRAQLETLFASGDPDRLATSDTVGGNLSGTPDRAFNSVGFANTGLAFAPSLSNIFTVRLGGSTFPFIHHPALARLQVGADVLVFNKLDADGPIDEPTFQKMYLGVEADSFVNYRVTSDLALSVRYGAFFPGAAINGPKDTRHFVLVAVTLSF